MPETLLSPEDRAVLRESIERHSASYVRLIEWSKENLNEDTQTVVLHVLQEDNEKLRALLEKLSDGTPASNPRPDKPSAQVKKPAKVRYGGSAADITATLKKHGAMSTFQLKETIVQDLNFKPSDNHLKYLLQVAQNHGRIKLDEESQKWMLP